MRYSAVAALFASLAVVAQARIEYRRDVELNIEARANKCDILACGKALAPTVEECAYVGTKLYDAPADIECIQAAVELGKDLPKVCSDCPAKYNVKVPNIKLPF